MLARIAQSVVLFFSISTLACGGGGGAPAADPAPPKPPPVASATGLYLSDLDPAERTVLESFKIVPNIIGDRVAFLHVSESSDMINFTETKSDVVPPSLEEQKIGDYGFQRLYEPSILKIGGKYHIYYGHYYASSEHPHPILGGIGDYVLPSKKDSSEKKLNKI